MKERTDLLRDLRDLPRNSAVRRVNELVKRARMAKVHALIISYLRSQMPSMFGKEKKQRELIENLADVFRTVQLAHKLHIGDFPNLAKFRENLAEKDFKKFPKPNERMLAAMDSVIREGIPRLLMQLGQEQSAAAAGKGTTSAPSEGAIQHFAPAADDSGPTYSDYPSPQAAQPPPPPAAAGDGGDNPFGAGGGGGDNPFGAEASPEQTEWEGLVDKPAAMKVFMGLPGAGAGKVTGGDCRTVMVASGLATDTLRKVWEASDIDKDGCLDEDEFALSHCLMEAEKKGKPIGYPVPPEYVPPSKRPTV